MKIQQKLCVKCDACSDESYLYDVHILGKKLIYEQFEELLLNLLLLHWVKSWRRRFMLVNNINTYNNYINWEPLFVYNHVKFCDFPTSNHFVKRFRMKLLESIISSSKFTIEMEHYNDIFSVWHGKRDFNLSSSGFAFTKLPSLLHAWIVSWIYCGYSMNIRVMNGMRNFAYSLMHRPIFSMVQSWIAVIKWNYEHSHIACMWIIKFIWMRCINKTMAEVDVKNVHFTVLSKNGA